MLFRSLKSNQRKPRQHAHRGGWTIDRVAIDEGKPVQVCTDRVEKYRIGVGCSESEHAAPSVYAIELLRVIVESQPVNTEADAS